VKRPDKASAAGLPSLAERQECITLSRFPCLEDLLCDPNWDDATPKGQRCVMVFIDDVATRLLVKLECDCLKFSVPGKDLDECLAAAELLLKTGKVVWEQDRPRDSGRPKKKK
jgi:hypothetical protein